MIMIDAGFARRGRALLCSGCDCWGSRGAGGVTPRRSVPPWAPTDAVNTTKPQRTHAANGHESPEAIASSTSS
ncbi:MAG: hypothetical protein WAK44_20960, partial [Trebonia sp.]|uniref:hypothetical protein n=1 Tax=Trebonia sp. TaxID=2767075 RepID=UPI003BB0AAAC